MKEVKNYAWPITSISKENYDAIIACVEDNKQLFNEKEILIFGAGIRGAEISVILKSVGYKNIIFTDNNKEKWGGCIDEFPIISVAEALNLKDKVVYLISVEEGDSICIQLEEEGLKRDTDYFYPKPNLYERFMTEFKREMHNEVLVMGDCMFEVVSFDDNNKDSLTEILQQKVGYDNIKLLTMHGMGLPTFYHALKAQINCGMIPKVFVVMINFETLTGKQHLLPRSQHTKLVKDMYDYSPDPDGELEKYVSVTEERVKNIQAEFFTTNKYSSQKKENNNRGVISDSASKIFFKLNYMYKLNTEIESIQYLIKIIKMAKQNGFKVVPFVPPVNYERGTELFGDDFEKAYSYNLEKLREVIGNEKIELLDLSHICTKNEFANVTTPDETTNYNGRVKVADKICQEIGRISNNG
jgi:hypothetical protein